MSRKKILIVEDEMILSLLMEEMVKQLGHEVIGKVTTGEEAIAVALDLAPDLILMDIRLQGKIDGIEAMNKIKQKSDIPVIYITGNSDRKYSEKINSTGYLDFLTKPVTKRDLSHSFGQAS